MPYMLSGEYPPVRRPLSSWFLAAEPSVGRLRLSWKLLVLSAARTMAAIAGTGRCEAPTTDYLSPTMPQIPKGNAAYEIMRIEVRRRI